MSHLCKTHYNFVLKKPHNNRTCQNNILGVAVGERIADFAYQIIIQHIVMTKIKELKNISKFFN